MCYVFYCEALHYPLMDEHALFGTQLSCVLIFIINVACEQAPGLEERIKFISRRKAPATRYKAPAMRCEAPSNSGTGSFG